MHILDCMATFLETIVIGHVGQLSRHIPSNGNSLYDIIIIVRYTFFFAVVQLLSFVAIISPGAFVSALLPCHRCRTFHIPFRVNDDDDDDNDDMPSPIRLQRQFILHSYRLWGRGASSESSCA